MDTGHKARLLEVIKGHCPADELPEQRSWTVRIYLASTPDMTAERDTILREVYPRIKQYCAGKYGIDFKFVELHWGVKESSGYRDNDCDIIRREIHLCQQKSLGPTFLGLLGHKLGAPLLPITLPGDHFLIILNTMSSKMDSPEDLMLKYYYQLDTDLLDFKPIFQLRTLQFNTMGRETPNSAELNAFRRTFRECVLEAASVGKLVPEDVIRYTPTMAEVEFEAGLSNKDQNRDTSLYLVRTIRDLNSHHTDAKYSKYCDVTDGIDDEVLQNRLLELREVKLRQYLPSANIKKVTTDWASASLVLSLTKEEKQIVKYAKAFKGSSALRVGKYEDYMDDIVNKVYSPLKQQIDRAAAPLSVEKKTFLDIVYADVAEHWRYMKDVDTDEVSHEAQTELQKYLEGDTPFAFILQGRYLDQRTAVIASVIDHQARELQYQEPTDDDRDTVQPYTVVRYLSYYQDHVTLQELLTSMCSQIYLLYKRPWRDSKSLDQLKLFFEKGLHELPTPSNPLHIVLDGVELVATSMEGVDVSWIPDNLPNNVKFVLSCSSAAESMLEAVSTKTPYTACIFNLDPEDDNMSANSSMRGDTGATRSSLNFTCSMYDEESTYGVGKTSLAGTDYQYGTNLTYLKENTNGVYKMADPNGEDHANESYFRGTPNDRAVTQLTEERSNINMKSTKDMNETRPVSEEGNGLYHFIADIVNEIIVTALYEVNQLQNGQDATDQGYDPNDMEFSDQGSNVSDGDDRPETPQQKIESDYNSEGFERPLPLPVLDRYVSKVMEEEWQLEEGRDIKLTPAVRWLRILEERHGKHLVSTFFTLLSSAKKGLTECELLDLLSLDEQLLNEGIFLGIQPFLRRLPELLLARLTFDLGSLLQVKDTDQRDVLTWSIPDVEKLTKWTYFNMINPASKVHQNMALYFMNLSSRPRPMDDSSTISSIPGYLTEPEVRVDPQPSIFEATETHYTKIHYNKRRLTELPHHLLFAEKITELCRNVIFSYKWIYYKLHATSPYELIATLHQLAMSSLALKEEPDVLALITALEESMPYLRDASSCLRSELTGRLLPRLGNSPSITNLIKQCDDDGYKHCPVSPLTTSFDGGQDEVEQIIPCDTGFYDELYMTPVPNTNDVITYTVPEKISMWDISTEEMTRRFECNQYTYCTELRVTRDGRYVMALNNGYPKQSFLDDSPILDIYLIETGEKVHRLYFNESNLKPKRLFRVMGLKDRKLLFDTPNYVAVCIDMVRLCHIKTGKEIAKITWPFILTPDERYLVLTENDGHKLVIRGFPDLQHITKFSSPKNITAMVAIATESSMDVLVSAGSAGVLSMYNLDNISSEINPVEPIFQGVLVDKKDNSVKGGCGSLILSPDNKLVLAIYIHASGKHIVRTNFLLSTKTLENVHIYESDVKDTAQFSPDGSYLLHLKIADGSLDIIETSSGETVKIAKKEILMKQITFGADSSTLLVATKDEIQVLDLMRLIEHGRRNRVEEVPIEDDVSVEFNTPRERLRTLTAEIPLSAMMATKSVNVIPVKLVQVNETQGVLTQTTMELHQGIHFTDLEFPSYMSETIITPDGSHILVIFEQLHVVGPKKPGSSERKVLSGPLKEDFHQTKVTSGSLGGERGRDVFGVGTNHLSHGAILQKGTKIYGTNDTKRGTVYEAEGGETIQRCPSVIRIYNAESGHCTQSVQIQNEKVLATSNQHVVTSSSDGEFTNIYDMTTGEPMTTLECAPGSANFTIDFNALVVVPRKPGPMLMIFRGPGYLDLRKCEVVHDPKLHIWEVMTCSHSPGVIIVSLIGEGSIAGVLYARVDVTYATVINTFSCHAELVQISPKGTLGVDSEFRFYDIANGKVLFQVQTEEVSLTEHSSYITDDGALMVFLDYETGKINVVDVQKKKLVSQSYFHPHRSRRNTLKGVREVVQVIPLHGGNQMVVLDQNSIKQFLLQTPKRQTIALGMVKLRKKAYVGPESRLAYFHFVNSDGDVPLTRLVNRRRHRRAAVAMGGHSKRKL